MKLGDMVMIYPSVITRNILQQNVLVFFLWARYLYHGQEIGLLDDMCHVIWLSFRPDIDAL